MATHFNAKTNFSTTPRSKPVHSSARFMPVAKAVPQNQSYWASIDAQIETYLKTALPIRPPVSVFEPMHHLTFAAPRTTASALCVAACELVGGDRSQATAAAAAIHLIHAAAYTHEHLPLTDRPWPTPTITHEYSPNVELLTGDGIVPFGLELLAGSMGQARSDPTQIMRVIIEVARASGSQGMVDGRYKELEIHQSESSSFELVEYVCKKKEGELHACGAACGAIFGGGTEAEVEKLRNFGLYVGTAKGLLAKGNPIMEGKIRELKELALKELESFEGKKTWLELITSLLEPSLCSA